MRKGKSWSERIWDAWCLISVVGIWPRFIEPNILSVTKLSLPFSNLPKQLHGLKILQFSDIHWSFRSSPRFFKKISDKINGLEPDLLFFTGDFLTRSVLEDPEGLQRFLCSLRAKEGYFAVLGNHDYDRFVTVSADGHYDTETPGAKSDVLKGFKRLFSSVFLSKKITPRAKEVRSHQALISLLHTTPFRLLHNETARVSVKGGHVNIVGLGEYVTGKADPESAFKQYDPNLPGIVLVHNPDAIPGLESYPGDLVLSGHTHGGQVNAFGLWKKLTYMENLRFRRGLIEEGTKRYYINRGLGSVLRFRWFAKPELTLFTLVGDK